MRKNISINISGIVFHIEEDGYDQLKDYLESINRYFSTFEDSKEIISDIESRIAEIFLAKLKDGNQIIKGADVEALIATMGSVADFEAIEEQEPVTPQAEAEAKAGTEPKPTEETAQAAPSRRLHRDNKRKILGGVASGIAHYFGLDPLWIRLALLILFFNVFFHFPTSGVILVAYILAWIIVPGSDELEEDQKIKKLFRNSEDRVLGGVSSGIAAYFGVDTTLIRLLFVLSIFLGGAGLVIYIILWIITPEAKSLTEKMEMQGEPVTLSNIETNLKKSFKVDEGEENAFVKVLLFPFRLLAAVFTGLGKALGPFLLFLVEAIRVIAGVAIAIVGLSMIFGLMVAAGVTVGVISGAHVTWDVPIPFEMVRTSIPVGAAVAAFFAGFIPALFITLLGVMVIAKQKVINATAGWSLFAAWVISVLVFSFTLPSFLYDFRTEGTYKESFDYDIGDKTAVLRLRDLNVDDIDMVHLALRGHAAEQFKLEKNITAKGGSREQAQDNAQTVAYDVTLEDSIFWFDSNIQFKDQSKYRFQEVNLVLLVPYDQPFIMESGLEHILRNRYYSNRAGNDTWVFTREGMVCISCDNGDYTSNEEDEDVGSTDPSRLFEVGEFDRLNITGNFRVRVSPGSESEIRIVGNERYFDDLRVENEGGTLVIEGNKDWDTRSGTRRLTINITTPEIKAADLQGSARVEIEDFELDYLQISMGGKTDAYLQGRIDDLDLELESASSLELSGSGGQLNVNLGAASKLKAFDFKVDRATVKATGASNAEVMVLEDLEIESSGVSNVRYRGTADVHIDQSGSGSIQED